MYISEFTYRACETPYNIEISLCTCYCTDYLLYYYAEHHMIYFDTCEVHAVIGYFVVSDIK